MYTFHLKWMRWALVALVTTLLSATSLTGIPSAAAQTPPKIGIACTSSPGSHPTFTLTTQTGYILLPDGNTMFMWGYSEVGKPFQHPGPVLCVNQGDTATVILQNNLSVPVSIVFPGQGNVLANSAPAQPQFDANNTVTSLSNV